MGDPGEGSTPNKKEKDRRSLAELERERELHPFLPLKPYLPALLYNAVVLIFEFARKFLFQKDRPDAREVAEDIASEFLDEEWNSHLKHLRGKPDDQVRSYCYKRAKRDVLDHLKDPRTRDHDRLPEDDDSPHGLSTGRPDVERLLELEDYEHEIERAIRRLTEAEQKVIRLRWREEMSFKEIAQVLGISAATARVQAYSAYAKMRPALQHLRTAYGRSGHESTPAPIARRSEDQSDD